MLFDDMLRLGARLGRIEAKVFGGAAVLPVGNSEDAVGAKNIAVALKCLRTLDIDVVARRTGGKNGTLIRLFTGTGDVLVRRVASSTVDKFTNEPAFEFGRRLPCLNWLATTIQSGITRSAHRSHATRRLPPRPRLPNLPSRSSRQNAARCTGSHCPARR